MNNVERDTGRTRHLRHRLHDGQGTGFCKVLQGAPRQLLVNAGQHGQAQGVDARLLWPHSASGGANACTSWVPRS